MFCNELVEVQQNLENQLPIYMVPQTWALIKKLPMLVSGKLDRKKITAWVEDIDDVSYDRIMADYDRIKRGKTEEKPQEKQEKNGSLDIVRDIFAQVLNISLQKVNVDRSFVSLGKYQHNHFKLVTILICSYRRRQHYWNGRHLSRSQAGTCSDTARYPSEPISEGTCSNRQCQGTCR